MPEVHQSILQRFASVNVDHANIEPEWDIGLVFNHVLSKCLRSRPDVGPFGNLGCEDADIILDHLVERSLSSDLVRNVGTSFKVPLAKRISLSVPLLVEVADSRSTEFGEKWPLG